MKKIRLIIVSLFSLGILISCSEDEGNSKESESSSSSISDKVFGGTVNEESYTAIDGDAFFGKSIEEKETLNVRISNQNFECNGDIFNSIDYVSVSIPTDSREVQELNVVLRVQGSSFGPINNLSGMAQIVSLSETEAVVKIKTKSLSESGSNSPLSTYNLEGKFTVEICPENK